MILHDANTRDYSTALVAYCSMACGLGLMDKIVKIGSFSPHSLWIPNLIFIPVPAESGELDATIKRIRQIKPDAVYAFPWVINCLLTVEVPGIEPKKIFSHGQTLTQHTRDLVRSRFGIEINDIYGAVEFGRLAFECNEHSGMHMITDNSIMEFLKEGGHVSPGERGEIVVTGLNNYVMPFIRYELGDMGVPTDEMCSCSRRWPLIKSLEGRVYDVFILESGRKIYPKIFYHFFNLEFKKNIFCVSEYQIVQEKRDVIKLKFVKGEKFDIKNIIRIQDNIKNFFSDIGENVTVEIQLVKEISMENTGKKKKFLSLLD